MHRNMDSWRYQSENMVGSGAENGEMAASRGGIFIGVAPMYINRNGENNRENAKESISISDIAM